MKPGAVIALVVGGIVLLFWAASKGLIKSGVAISPSGTPSGIVAPQPASNYSGYLAASTAPAVTGAINSALTGLSGSLASWLGSSSSPTPALPASGTNPSSPALAAQPVGPQPPPLVGLPLTAYVGPQVDPTVSYDATSGAAFDYSGLSTDNGFDQESSLMYV